jgi:hypothetical protein
MIPFMFQRLFLVNIFPSPVLNQPTELFESHMVLMAKIRRNPTQASLLSVLKGRQELEALGSSSSLLETFVTLDSIVLSLK